MFRRLFALILLLLLVGLLWGGARWFHQSRELRATVVFDQPSGLHRGDPVLQDEKSIGTVEEIGRLDDRQTATIRVARDSRNAVRTDSLIRVAAVDGHRALVIDSSFSLGRPVEDRAVLHAHDSEMARMIERGGEALTPLARTAREKGAALLAYDRGDFQRELDSWSGKLPQWKKEGNAAFDRHLSEIKAKSEATERSLRRAGRGLEADQLRARFSAWIESARKRISSNS